MISECIRTSAKALGIQNISTIDRDTRIMLQADALRTQQTIEGVYASGFVADRSAYDYAAYVMGFFGECSFSEIYLRNAAKSVYDFLIYVPPFDQQGQREDGFRLDPTSFAAIEAEVRRQLSPELMMPRLAGTSCRYHWLRSTGYEARLNEIKAILPKY